MDRLQEIKEKIQKKNAEGKYSLFSTDVVQKYVNSDSIDIVFDIISYWDEHCNIPIELGEFLNSISSDERNLVAFSRFFIGTLDSKNPGEVKSNEIVDIASNGLKNNGHINSSGAHQELNSPSDALTPLKGIEGWIQLVGSYKNNNSVILYSFPSKFIDSECHFKDNKFASEIYDFDDNIVHFKPEYLIGMIVKNKDAVDVFISKDDMITMNNSKTM